MFQSDPRFGSIYILAAIAKICHVSGMFSYDCTCTVILTAAFLGMAGLYTRSSVTFIGLIVGLYFLTPRPLTIINIASLALVTCATAIVYPGFVSAFYFTLLGGIYVATSCLLDRKKLSNEFIVNEPAIIIILNR